MIGARLAIRQMGVDFKRGIEMTFVESVQVCFAKYADFSGRASRSEYWFFALFGFLGQLVGSMIDPMLGAVFTVAILLPSLAAAVRRLHDTDRSGWFYLLALIPVIGGLILLVLFCLSGTDGPNRFDSEPSEPTAPGATKPGV